jgi:hypothetical protein
VINLPTSAMGFEFGSLLLGTGLLRGLLITTPCLRTSNCTISTKSDSRLPYLQ